MIRNNLLLQRSEVSEIMSSRNNNYLLENMTSWKTTGNIYIKHICDFRYAKLCWSSFEFSVFYCFMCVRPVSCVLKVASFSGLPILYFLFGFLKDLFTHLDIQIITLHAIFVHHLTLFKTLKPLKIFLDRLFLPFMIF